MQLSFKLAARRSLPDNALGVSSVTDTSAEITWKRSSVSSDLSNYYEFVIEYKEETSSTWQELLGRKHSETTSDTQSIPLSGLTYNTEYDVRLTLYRVMKSNRDDTDSETRTFKTYCIGKNAAFFASLFQCLDLGSAKDTLTSDVYFLIANAALFRGYSGLALVRVCVSWHPLKWIKFTLQSL